MIAVHFQVCILHCSGFLSKEVLWGRHSTYHVSSLFCHSRALAISLKCMNRRMETAIADAQINALSENWREPMALLLEFDEWPSRFWNVSSHTADKNPITSKETNRRHQTKLFSNQQTTTQSTPHHSLPPHHHHHIHPTPKTDPQPHLNAQPSSKTPPPPPQPQ